LLEARYNSSFPRGWDRTYEDGYDHSPKRWKNEDLSNCCNQLSKNIHWHLVRWSYNPHWGGRETNAGNDKKGRERIKQKLGLLFDGPVVRGNYSETCVVMWGFRVWLFPASRHRFLSSFLSPQGHQIVDLAFAWCALAPFCVSHRFQPIFFTKLLKPVKLY